MGKTGAIDPSVSNLLLSDELRDRIDVMSLGSPETPPDDDLEGWNDVGRFVVDYMSLVNQKQCWLIRVRLGGRRDTLWCQLVEATWTGGGRMPSLMHFTTERDLRCVGDILDGFRIVSLGFIDERVKRLADIKFSAIGSLVSECSFEHRGGVTHLTVRFNGG